MANVVDVKGLAAGRQQGGQLLDKDKEGQEVRARRNQLAEVGQHSTPVTSYQAETDDNPRHGHRHGDCRGTSNAPAYAQSQASAPIALRSLLDFPPWSTQPIFSGMSML